MEKKTKKALVPSVLAVALLVSVSMAWFMQSSGLTPKSYLVFALDSNPDSYGNKIMYVTVQQYDGSWNDYRRIDTGNYTQGMTVEIESNYDYRLKASVFLNKTLATDCSEASDNTRVYFNVSGEFTDVLGTYSDCTRAPPVIGDFWVLYVCTTSWTAATDTAYTCTVEYEAYY